MRYAARNWKRKAGTTTAGTIDAELWLQAAHGANDGDTVT